VGPLVVLTRRADFVRLSHGQRAGTAALNLQARPREGASEGAHVDVTAGVRVGFTCSKKVGNAVARNRAKRRLRAAAREVLPLLARPGWDYVLVGRPVATAERPWPLLLDDLRGALARVHEAGPPT
jgi:ribonuclease P protein component